MPVTVGEAQAQIRSKTHFVVGMRFEIFHALQAVVDASSQIHLAWKERSIGRLPPEFRENLRFTGGESPHFWSLLGDVLQEDVAADASFYQIVAHLDGVCLGELQRRILTGFVQCPELAAELVSGSKVLEAAVSSVSDEPLRRWYEMVGLFPFSRDSDIARGLDRLIRTPSAYRSALVDVLSVFWDIAFRPLWRGVQPALQRSCEEKRRLFDSCSLAEFVEQALLRIEVDEEAQVITCHGCPMKFPFDGVDGVYFIPSLFNEKRIWNYYYEHDGRTTMYFPYFEPSISPPELPRETEAAAAAPTPGGPLEAAGLDPVLIFRALGDATRYKIAAYIAERPRTASEIARHTRLSKPTVSHHVAVLRKAGLIVEDRSARSVLISLSRGPIAGLSDLAMHGLFEEREDRR